MTTGRKYGVEVRFDEGLTRQIWDLRKQLKPQDFGFVPVPHINLIKTKDDAVQDFFTSWMLPSLTNKFPIALSAITPFSIIDKEGIVLSLTPHPSTIGQLQLLRDELLRGLSARDIRPDERCISRSWTAHAPVARVRAVPNEKLDGLNNQLMLQPLLGTVASVWLVRVSPSYHQFDHPKMLLSPPPSLAGFSRLPSLSPSADTDILATSRKAVSCNFFPGKDAEDAAAAENIPPEVTRSLLKTTEALPDFSNNPIAEGPIKRHLTVTDVATGRLRISQKEMFDCILISWPLEDALSIFEGERFFVTICDFGDSSSNVVPKKYQSENIYLEIGTRQERLGHGNDLEDVYYIGWMDLVRDRKLLPGDEICMNWDVSTGALHFKLLRRGN